MQDIGFQNGIKPTWHLLSRGAGGGVGTGDCQKRIERSDDGFIMPSRKANESEYCKPFLTIKTVLFYGSAPCCAVYATPQSLDRQGRYQNAVIIGMIPSRWTSCMSYPPPRQRTVHRRSVRYSSPPSLPNTPYTGLKEYQFHT